MFICFSDGTVLTKCNTRYKRMSVVISIRVPKKLKEKMNKFKDVNWSEEIRKFIEERISQYEVDMILKRTEEHLRDVPELPSGTVCKWLRGDRGSH